MTDRLAYEWDAATHTFRPLPDPHLRQFDDNWQTVLAVLRGRTAAITVREIQEFWPPTAERLSRTVLYEWLALGHAKKLVRREGRGSSASPWKYRLENEDDAYLDRGELPRCGAGTDTRAIPGCEEGGRSGSSLVECCG